MLHKGIYHEDTCLEQIKTKGVNNAWSNVQHEIEVGFCGTTFN